MTTVSIRPTWRVTCDTCYHSGSETAHTVSIWYNESNAEVAKREHERLHERAVRS